MQRPTFVKSVTHVSADWANLVTALVFDALGQATSLSEVKLVLGLGSMSGQHIDNVALLGGKIDGVVIGGETPADGHFAKLTTTDLQSATPGSVMSRYATGIAISQAIASLGLRSMSTQSASQVAITGGTGVFDGLSVRVQGSNQNAVVTVGYLGAQLDAISAVTPDQLALKADLVYVDSQLALKADLVYVDNQLAGKATTASVSAKADLVYVDSQLALKADLSYVNSQLALKASVASVSLKADLSYVDSQLALKADAAELATKVSTSTYTAGLALKADLAGATFTGPVVVPSNTSTANATLTRQNVLDLIAGLGGGGTRHVDVEYASSVTLDADTGNDFRVVLAGDMTLNITGGGDGDRINVQLVQGTTGGHTVTLGPSIAVGDDLSAAPLSSTVGKYDILGFRVDTPSGKTAYVALNRGF